MLSANYKDGVIRDGSSIGRGTVLGNVKDGVIRAGGNSYIGSGKVILNIKDGVVRASSNSYIGSGDKKGAVNDFKINGMERELDSEMIAAYHFLVKKIV